MSDLPNQGLALSRIGRLGDHPARSIATKEILHADEEPRTGQDGGRTATGRGAGERGAVAAMGTIPQRAPMGHGPRGLQRERRRLELLHPRSGTIARLSLGRGWPRRFQRRQAAAVLFARPVERQGPDPQGAAVRPDQQRGQSRRGRQGVLLLPRQHTDPLIHEVSLQVSAERISLRRSGRDEPAARPQRSGIRAARYRRVQRGSLFRRVRRIREGRRRPTS